MSPVDGPTRRAILERLRQAADDRRAYETAWLKNVEVFASPLRHPQERAQSSLREDKNP